MKKTTKGMKGITDWDKKRKALRLLFGSTRDEELAAAILANGTEEQANALRESFKNWHSNNDPTGNTGRLFIESLAKRLVEKGSKSKNIQAIIWKGTYKNFYEIIPENFRAGIQKPEEADNETINSSLGNSNTHYPVWVNCLHPYETVESCLINGRIDQKFHYLSPDSADLWRKIINSDEYHQYKECKSAFEVICKDNNVWRMFFQKNNGVIMLGGGSPSKDLLIMNSVLELLPSSHKVIYAIIDYSHYMLDSSFMIINHRLVSDEHYRSRIKLSFIRDDFLKLSGIKKILKCENKNVAWIFPGGTIGNVDERKFFDSIANEATSGDLLIIGAEMIGDQDVTDKYDTWAVKQLISTPLRALWHKLSDKGSLQEMLTRIETNIVSGENNDHSMINGSKTIEMLLPSENIVLATSTRYDEKHFIEFAARKFFYLEASEASMHNPNYKQLIFRFNPPI